MLDLSVVVLPDQHPPQRFVEEVREAERCGVRTAWTYDHLAWPRLAGSPWHAAVPLLALAAAATTRVRLGPQVATPNFRHPVPFAAELVTLDHASGGRLEVGLGAGSTGPDARVLGQAELTRAERTARFAEWVDLLDAVLRGPVTTRSGRWASAVDAHRAPTCHQQPRVPFAVAAAGPRGAAVAARHAGTWLTYGPYGEAVDEEVWFAALAAQGRTLDAALAAQGRAPGSLRRAVQVALDAAWPFASAARWAEVVERLGALGFDEVCVHWPRDDGAGVPRAALGGVLAATSAASTTASTTTTGPGRPR